MNGTQKTLLGFIAGIAVGAGIYAFMQSDEGKAWMKKMKQKADDWKTDLSDLMEKGKEMAESFSDNAETQEKTA